MTVLHVVNGLIGSESDSFQTRTKACFILCTYDYVLQALFQYNWIFKDNLVADEKDLCQLAYNRCSLTRLATLVKAITPSETSTGWDEDEPESVACLREVRLRYIQPCRYIHECEGGPYRYSVDFSIRQ